MEKCNSGDQITIIQFKILLIDGRLVQYKWLELMWEGERANPYNESMNIGKEKAPPTVSHYECTS